MKQIGRWAVAGLVSAFFLAPAAAQVDKGFIETSFTGSIDWNEQEDHLPGTMFFPFDTTQTSESWGIGISGRAGYFLSKRIDVGGTLSLNYSDVEFVSTAPASNSEGDSWRWSIGPGFNYHFRPASKMVPFIGADVGYYRSRSEQEGSRFTTVGKQNGWFSELRVGTDVFLNRHVALKFGLRYRHRDGESEAETSAIGFPSFPIPPVDYTSDNVNLFVGLGIFLH